MLIKQMDDIKVKIDGNDYMIEELQLQIAGIKKENSILKKTLKLMEKLQDELKETSINNETSNISI